MADRRERMTQNARDRAFRMVVRKDERAEGYVWFDVLQPALRGIDRPVFTQRCGPTDYARLLRALRSKYSVPGSNVYHIGFTPAELTRMLVPFARVQEVGSDEDDNARLGEATGDPSDDGQGHDRMQALREESAPEADPEGGQTRPED